MENIELFERLGLAIAIGAAVGVERHWREREERQGARTAGIRTFTMIGMMGGVVALIERVLLPASPYPGLLLAAALVALAAVSAIFELREAIAQESYSVTSVIATMLTFALGALAVLGDMAVASAGGAALVALLAAREFLHAAIRRLQWVELRSAVILLIMTFVLLPVIPAEPLGPFGGVTPREILVLAILLASISFVGYITVRLLGPSRGDVVAGAISGLVSSTAATIAFARRSTGGEAARPLAAGAVSAGAVSLLRTALLVFSLAVSLAPMLLPPLISAAAVMAAYGLFLARRGVAGEGAVAPQANPFELPAVLKMAVLLVAVAFAARAASQYFGDAGLIWASALAGLADVDAPTVTVAGMRNMLTPHTASLAIAAAVLGNLCAKAVYALVFGSRPFALHIWLATSASIAFGAAVFIGQSAAL